MFVRFRQTKRLLQVSLIETRRVDGRVRHEHIASLGSVPREATSFDRFEFWTKLGEPLGKLANRLDSDGQAAIVATIDARIPAPTREEAERASTIGRRTKTDRRYDAMLAEILAHGGAEMTSKYLAEEVKLAERRTIRLIWDYLQILKQQQAPPPP